MQIPRHWRLNSQRYALQGVTCANCSANIFPPREVCPYCEGRAEHAYNFESREKTTVAGASVSLEPAAR